MPWTSVLPSKKRSPRDRHPRVERGRWMVKEQSRISSGRNPELKSHSNPQQNPCNKYDPRNDCQQHRCSNQHQHPCATFLISTSRMKLIRCLRSHCRRCSIECEQRLWSIDDLLCTQRRIQYLRRISATSSCRVHHHSPKRKMTQSQNRQRSSLLRPQRHIFPLSNQHQLSTRLRCKVSRLSVELWE